MISAFKGNDMTDFNLTREPWVPCLDANGKTTLLSTREVLTKAHELRGFAAMPPTQTPVVARHLIAILHRAYKGPTSRGDWERIVDSGAFDAAKVNAYLDTVEARMNLFDEEQPFAQTAGLREKFEGRETPIAQLEFTGSSWGAGSGLFYPSVDSTTFSPAQACRALLAHHAFAPGGFVKKPGEPDSATGAPNNGMALVLLLGGNLFETLVANMLVYDVGQNPVPSGQDDAPAWEQERPPRDLNMKKEPSQPFRGWLDMLTWESRRLQLVRSPDGLVSSFIRAVGKGVSTEIQEPFAAYQETKKFGERAFAVRKDRLFWRDSSALFAPRVKGKFRARAPKAAAQATGTVGLPKRMGVGVFGMASDRAKIDTTREEFLWVSPELFNRRPIYDAIDEALGDANYAVRGLTKGLETYARWLLSASKDRTPEKGNVTSLASGFGAEALAWSALGERYQTFLNDLADRATAQAHADFRRDALAVAERIYDDVVRGGGAHQNALAAGVKGLDEMRKYVSKLRKADREYRENTEAA